MDGTVKMELKSTVSQELSDFFVVSGLTTEALLILSFNCNGLNIAKNNAQCMATLLYAQSCNAIYSHSLL